MAGRIGAEALHHCQAARRIRQEGLLESLESPFASSRSSWLVHVRDHVRRRTRPLGGRAAKDTAFYSLSFWTNVAKSLLGLDSVFMNCTPVSRGRAT